MSSGEQETGRRARTRLRKTRAIRQVALELLEDGGLEALSLHQVARQLDWSVAGLYRYFDSKAALITDLECRVFAYYQGLLDALLETPPADVENTPLVRTMLVIHHYRHHMLRRRGWYALIGMTLSDPRPILSQQQGRRVMDHARQLFEQLAAQLQQGVDSGLLDPGNPVERAVVLWIAGQGTLQADKLARLAPDLFERDSLFEGLVCGLLHGWGGPSADVARADRAARRWLASEQFDESAEVERLTTGAAAPDDAPGS